MTKTAERNWCHCASQGGDISHEGPELSNHSFFATSDDHRWFKFRRILAWDTVQVIDMMMREGILVNA